MKNVFKKLNKIIFVCIMMISMIILTGCFSGVVYENQYCEIFGGIDSEYGDGNSVYYQMKTLVDNTEFNNTIQSKHYCKLDISLKQKCQIKGVVFIVRSLDTCTLKFTTFIDEVEKSTITKEIEKEIVYGIDMFIDNAEALISDSNYLLQIKELNKQEDEERTSFIFDSFVIFLQE